MNLLLLVHQYPQKNSVKILNGFGPEFRQVSASIRTHSIPIQDEEMLEKLMDHELLLRLEGKHTSSPIIATVGNRNNGCYIASRNNKQASQSPWRTIGS
ncbi:hypothetical protein J1N35_007959 [Gossypium stocksii]|uniref:Uncharacterized protein n=1 Tax=Gossypium stocksii TaxID=47602 RepID=A0A9D3W881_9ROSI|nr:hypothetical protein J1N35_007959 [Gossypium stocksii]